MRSKKRTRIILSYVLMAAILSTAAPNRMVSAETAEKSKAEKKTDDKKYYDTVKKAENVYAKLNFDGKPSTAYVINHFELAGEAEITDYGKYNEIKNLTDTEELKMEGEKLSVKKGKGSFYYQGTLNDVELPWNFSVKYLLDEKEISAENLGGASGSLEIILKMEQNKTVNDIFYKNYLMQVSFTLPEEKCSNIEAGDGTVSDAGSDRNITFTLMPEKEGNFTVRADVTDFEMSGLAITCVPYSMSVDMDDFDSDAMLDEFDELTDAVSDLNDGMEELNDGIQELNDGSEDLGGGARDLDSGLKKLSKNGSTITSASKKIEKALKQVNAGLSKADFSQMSSLTELPKNLNQLAGGLKQLEDGMGTLHSRFSASYQVLDGAFTASKGNVLSEEEMGAMQQAAKENTTALSAYTKLMASYQALLTLQGTYEQVKPAFQAVNSSLDKANKESVLNGIKTVSTGIQAMSSGMSASVGKTDVAAQMKKLQKGMAELYKSYGAFHKGLKQYTDGVAKIHTGYSKYANGLTEYLDGVGKIADGSKEYADGMDEFDGGVSEMPDKVQDSIDEMTEKYTETDFDAVSFVDERNENIDKVQFILSTPAIEIPETEEAEKEEKQMGFWERLKNLFRF